MPCFAPQYVPPTFFHVLVGGHPNIDILPKTVHRGARRSNKPPLDADGRSHEGLRRLEPVLKMMKGPTSELTTLLGGGMDASEILLQ